VSGLRALAEFAACFDLAAAPKEVVQEGRRQLLDTVGVIIGAASVPEVRALAAIEARDPGPATFLGQDGWAAAEAAALVNATAGVWLDYDSGQRASGSHPAVHVVPAALAIAEEVGASGADLLSAVIVGCEVGARMGAAAGRLHPLLSPHGSWPVLGAAAAAARLLGFDGAQLAATLEVASSLTLLTSTGLHTAGANGRHLQAGLGAQRGIVAARLQAAGFTGDPEGCQQVFGRLVTPTFNTRRLAIGLGRQWEFLRGYYKPYACARVTHAAIDALLEIRRQRAALGIHAEDVVAIEVVTFAAAAALADPHPTSELAARFSLPYILAATWVRGDAGPASFATTIRRHPAVRRLAERVRLREDPEYTALTPEYRPATVSVQFRDGTSLTVERLNASGEPDDPLLPLWLEEKFDGLVAPVLGRERAQHLRQQLLQVEQVPAVAELTALTIPPRP
jgi:2-methylcitrate dehydratase PrpD